MTVGAEPRAVAVSPNGDRLYVANSASNSLTVVDTKKDDIIATVDLSAFGTAPRSIAVTNNGNKVDTDETVYVGMFFSQLRAGKTAVQEGQDDQREARVVAISAASNKPLSAPNPVLLEPLANAGFNANGRLAPGPGHVVRTFETHFGRRYAAGEPIRAIKADPAFAAARADLTDAIFQGEAT